MKLYLFVRADLHITEKPAWLDDFRKVYDEIFPYHLSLKRAVEAPESDIPVARNKVLEITSHFKPFELNFRELFVGKTKYGYTVMVRAENLPALHALRDQVVASFKQYTTYYQPEHKKFDEDFNPHVTIARHLTEEQLEEAKTTIHEPLKITAMINSLHLVFTKEPHDITFKPEIEETIPFSAK